MPQAVTLTTANAVAFLESIGLLPASRQATVVVFAGQSNVLSAGYIDQFEGTGNVLDTLQPSILRQFSRVFIWNPVTKAYELLQARVNNLGHQGRAIGPEMGFAQWWEDNMPGNLYIIKQSIPGVPISTWDDGQPGWSELSTYLSEGKATLAAAGLAPIVRGFFWNQGESNGNDSGYRPKLQNLSDRLYNRGLLTVDTKAVIALMRYDSTMRAQQTQFADQNKAYVKLVETAGYGMNPDNLHFKATTQFLSGYTDIPNALYGLNTAYPFSM